MRPATVQRCGAHLASSGWQHHREPYGDALLCALMAEHPELTWFLGFDGFDAKLGAATLSLWVMPKDDLDKYNTADARCAAERSYRFCQAWIAGYKAAQKAAAEVTT